MITRPFRLVASAMLATLPLLLLHLPTQAMAQSQGCDKVGVEVNWPIDNDGTILLTPEVIGKIAATGTRLVRVNFRLGPWASPSDPNWIAAFDQIVNNLKQRNIDVYALITHESVSPYHGDLFRTPVAETHPQPEAFLWMSLYGENFEYIVNHFKDRVRYFETYNEPNDWRGGSSAILHPEWFASLLQEVWARQRTNQWAGITIVTGPILAHEGNEGEVWEYLVDTYGAGARQYEWTSFPFSHFALHPYVALSSTDPQTIRALMHARLEELELAASWGNIDTPRIYVSEFGTPIDDDSQKASYLSGAFSALKAHPRVELAIWFSLIDTTEGPYGLYHGDYTPYPETLSAFRGESCGAAITDTVFIIDSSGSMSSNDPQGRRKDAAKAFLTMTTPGSSVGVVDFDSSARTLTGLIPLETDDAVQYVSRKIDLIDSSGGTNIGAGVREGSEVLQDGSNPERAAILLTDGVGAYNNEHAVYQRNNWRIFTIGFGSADDTLLRRIAEETGGEHNMGEPSLRLSGKEPVKAPSKVVLEGDELLVIPTGAGTAGISPDTLVCAFQHIRSKIDGGAGARCARHTLQARRAEMLPVIVPPSQRYWTLTVSWSQLSAPPSVRLLSPTGRIIDGTTVAPDVAHDKGRTYEVFRLAQAEPGIWTVQLESPLAQQAVIGTADIPWSMPNRPPDVSGAVPELARLWPPSHRFVETGITGVTDPEGDAFTLSITGVTQDERVREEGSGKTAPDASGVGTSRASLRAERAGGGNGRVYRVTFVARDERGASAQGSVLVCVPHDQAGGACVDDGQHYDSTQP